MNRKQFGEMLREIREARDNQNDPQNVVDKYRKQFMYAYVYSDPIAKSIFGSEQFKSLTIDFMNAILDLKGDEYYKDRLVYYIARQPGRQQPPCAVAARDRCHQQRGKRRFQRQKLQALAKRRKIE